MRAKCGLSRGSSPESMLDEALESIKELIHHGGVDQGMIRSDARLAGVEILAPRYTFGSHIHIGMAVNDRRGFATKFECDRCEVRCRKRQDLLPDRGASGERRDPSGSRSSRPEPPRCLCLVRTHKVGGQGFADYALQHGRCSKGPPHLASARRNCLRQGLTNGSSRSNTG